MKVKSDATDDLMADSNTIIQNSTISKDEGDLNISYNSSLILTSNNDGFSEVTITEENINDIFISEVVSEDVVNITDK